MRTADKDSHAAELCKRAGLMADAAIECLDFVTFYKYQRICNRLLQYRINLELNKYATR